jgi:hypothetical protein
VCERDKTKPQSPSGEVFKANTCLVGQEIQHSFCNYKVRYNAHRGRPGIREDPDSYLGPAILMKVFRGFH